MSNTKRDNCGRFASAGGAVKRPSISLDKRLDLAVKGVRREVGKYHQTQLRTGSLRTFLRKT